MYKSKTGQTLTNIVEKLLNGEVAYDTNAHTDYVNDLLYGMCSKKDYSYFGLFLSRAHYIEDFCTLDFLISEMGDAVYEFWDELVALRHHPNEVMRYRIAWMLCFYARSQKDYRLLIDMLNSPYSTGKTMAVNWLCRSERDVLNELNEINFDKEEMLSAIQLLQNWQSYDLTKIRHHAKGQASLTKIVLFKIAILIDCNQEELRMLVRELNDVTIFNCFYIYLKK